ncbi:protein kinase [Marinicella sp. S1101]|uniref:serine/threonine-protein kinase n=1 Tax=Marinicella marina TaxID=2996016 RepID=UPI002260F494|nr:serine/threonine-protein kinase [Marinicella marina]MCX7554284.1 protein kinase [Marinicella marina]MDJ1138725.1 protein kinase [Marinicella marina]
MAQQSGIKLSSKLMLITGFLILLTVAVSIFITLYFGNQIANEGIEKKLSSSQLIQQEFNQQKLRQLELVSMVVASDPAFVAYVAQTIFDLENNERADIASIADLLLERKQQYGFEVAIIVSADGQQIARSDQAMAAPKNLAEDPLMENAIDQLLPVSGYWTDSKQLYQAAVVPLSRGRNLIGFLLTGLAVDDVLANDIARLSGTEVAVVAEQSGQYTTLATTLDLDKNANLIERLNAIDANDLTRQQNLSLSELNLATRLSELSELGDTEYFIFNGVSVNEAMAPFIKTRNLLLAAGLGIVILALIIARFFVNQSLSSLNKISAATRQVSYGNYSAKFPKNVGADMSDLSESINQLVQNLRGRDALASHLVELSKKSHHEVERMQNPAKVLIEPGKVINQRFEVIKNIGVGGMGAVFQAYDQELEEVVALKVLKTQQASESDIVQFKDEIKVARRISHPNVVRIHDFGQLKQNVYISMEFVQGYTLEQILRFAKKLRPAAAKHAAIHICSGLIAAHEAGVVHKDLKPANIIVELDSSIKLMDFGIASIDSIISEKQSNAMVGGTAAYIAPEQALGKGADERTDIYALGVLLMELFIGQRPFYGSDDEDLMMKHVSETPLPISTQWADAPKSLEQLILKCLAKQPKDRPQTVQAVLSELKQIKFNN